MEKAILVGLETPHSTWSIEETMNELAELVETAGGCTLVKIIQKKTSPDRTFYVGKGKAEEIKTFVEELEADIVVFDDELSPSQIRNLERVIDVRVVDRTALILDIFAQRAQTREGKLQVELAQLNYILPRLTGLGQHLSRLGGGIGTRGPGETKLESDKRRIRKKIGDLKKEIEEIKQQRSLHRKARQDVSLPIVTLVGYTNAGKSTILNALTSADVFTEDKLFATLDPTTRKVILPGGRIFLLTDTVGFIQKLPHHLVASFRASLEEVLEADILLHVVDTSHPQAAGQMTAVNEIISELGASNCPMLVVFNKLDLPESHNAITALASGYERYVAVSAVGQQGLDDLLLKLEEMLQANECFQEFRLPYGSEAILATIRKYGRIISLEYLNNETAVKAVLTKELAEKIRHRLNKQGER